MFSEPFSTGGRAQLLTPAEVAASVLKSQSRHVLCTTRNQSRTSVDVICDSQHQLSRCFQEGSLGLKSRTKPESSFP